MLASQPEARVSAGRGATASTQGKQLLSPRHLGLQGLLWIPRPVSAHPPPSSLLFWGEEGAYKGQGRGALMSPYVPSTYLLHFLLIQIKLLPFSPIFKETTLMPSTVQILVGAAEGWGGGGLSGREHLHPSPPLLSLFHLFASVPPPRGLASPFSTGWRASSPPDLRAEGSSCSQDVLPPPSSQHAIFFSFS